MRPPKLIFLLALRAKSLFLASPLPDGVEVLQRPRHDYLGNVTDTHGSILGAISICITTTTICITSNINIISSVAVQATIAAE